MKWMEKHPFGVTKDGQEINIYVMENDAGMAAAVTPYGASLVYLLVPDKDGYRRDVVLGYNDVQGYEEGTVFFGATVGRNANRIAGASFEINGKTYKLEANQFDNSLHSGSDCYNKRIWMVTAKDKHFITFALISEDGDQGFPGKAVIRVTYELTEDNTLKIIYDGRAEEDTIFNMTNHSYFNLNGHECGDVMDHVVTLDADYYTRADAHSIPTGELTDVTGTPMDFRTMHTVGERISADYGPLRLAGGYDHNYNLPNDGQQKKVAWVRSPKTGIEMEVWTDLCGIQIYTGNFLDHRPGKDGMFYEKNAGICFETQFYPNSCKEPAFPSCVFGAGKVFESETAFIFR